MKKIILIIMVITMIFGSQTFAKSYGTNTAAFMRLGAGGRAAGLGDAHSAVMPNDASGEYWNIGAMAFAEKHSVSFMHNKLYQDVSHNYFAINLKTSEKSALSASISYVAIEDMQRILKHTDHTPIVQGVFESKNSVLSLGYSYKFNESLSCGLKIKSITSDIDIYSANATAFDAGALWKLNNEFNVSLVVKNIGTKMKYYSVQEKLPLITIAGISYKFIDAFLIAADISFPDDENPILNTGIEYSSGSISLRAGYASSNHLENKGLTNYGFGIKVAQMNVDYAFQPFGILGDSHKLSVSLNF